MIYTISNKLFVPIKATNIYIFAEKKGALIKKVILLQIVILV